MERITTRLEMILSKKTMRERLKCVMAMYGDTIRDLAKLLNRTEQTIYNKLNESGTEFTLVEITKIKDYYQLTMDEVEAIFFLTASV